MKHALVWLTRAAVFFPAVAVLALVLTPAAKPPPAWRTNLTEAANEAKAAGKDLLVEFTARDGVGGVRALDRVVFDDARFLRGVEGQFVPVRLSVSTDPTAGAGDAGVVELAERLAVGRIPSLVLMDGGGRPYAAVESDAESVDTQLDLVQRAADERRLRDEAFIRAAASSGHDRARHLHTGLQHVGRVAVTGYEAAAREIVSLDPDNALRLNEQYAPALAERRIDEAVQTTVYPLIDRADFAGAVAAIDRIIADQKPPTAHLQTLAGFKGQILSSMGKKDEARRVLRDALAVAPDSASAGPIRAAIEQLGE